MKEPKTTELTSNNEPNDFKTTAAPDSCQMADQFTIDAYFFGTGT